MVINNNSRGEILSSKSVTWILLLLGFALVLFFFALFPWNKEVTEETCHQSIVLRSAYNMGKLVDITKSLPLKCKTKDVCIGISSASCDQYAGKKPVEKKVEFSSIREMSNSIIDQIAEEMYDCHAMLGEGNLAFMPSKSLEKNYCLICSRISFDKNVVERMGTNVISYNNFYNRLEQLKDPQGNSYLEFLYKDWKDSGKTEEMFNIIMNGKKDNAGNIISGGKLNPKNNAVNTLSIDEWNIDPSSNKEYAIIYQIRPDDTDRETISGIVGGIVGLVAGKKLGTFGIALGALTIKGTYDILGELGIDTAGGDSALDLWILVASDFSDQNTIFSSIIFNYPHPYKNTEEGGQAPFTYSPPAIIPYDPEMLDKVGCSSFEN